MVFGWINLFNLAILIIMLIPNMLFAGKIRQEEGIERNTILRISEYVSRIACMIFMFFPIRTAFSVLDLTGDDEVGESEIGGDEDR